MRLMSSPVGLPRLERHRSLRQLGLAVGFSQHPNQHRPQRPILLAVDQELGEGAALWVAQNSPSHPVCPLEVGEHEDMEELGTRSWTEGLQAFAKPALTLVGSHDRRLRGRTGVTWLCAVYWPQPTGRSPSLTAEKVGAGAAAKSPGAVPLGHQEAARIDSTLCPLRLPRTQSG
jgi:hypothetical protein